MEIPSGLPVDSYYADERAADRRLRDLRGRVKAARAAVSATPGLAEILEGDPEGAARFCARFEITEKMFVDGIPAEVAGEEADLPELLRDWIGTRRTGGQSLGYAS